MTTVTLLEFLINVQDLYNKIESEIYTAYFKNKDIIAERFFEYIYDNQDHVTPKFRDNMKLSLNRLKKILGWYETCNKYIILFGFTCCYKTQSGYPCKNTSIIPRGPCRYHKNIIDKRITYINTYIMIPGIQNIIMEYWSNEKNIKNKNDKNTVTRYHK
jgi:hypothetical protein